MKKKLAERLRMLRLARSMSQQNMADELNITVAAYSNIERGVAEVNMTRLSDIARILGTTPVDLLTEPTPVNDSENIYNTTLNQQLLLMMQQLQLFQQQLDALQREVAALKAGK